MMPPEVQRRNARPQTLSAGRKNVADPACRGEVRGHDSTTAGADGMHFIDERFRPGIANTIPPRPTLSNWREGTDATDALPPGRRGQHAPMQAPRCKQA